MGKDTKKDLLYEDEVYKIIGVAIEVHKELGAPHFRNVDQDQEKFCRFHPRFSDFVEQ